jgi:ComF family protein
MLDLILPPRAMDDGSPSQSPGLSGQSWSRIVFIDGPVCDGCGAPFPHDLGDGVRCPACLTKPRVFSRARAACLYDDASRDLILQLKHADRTELAGLLSAWISRAAADLIETADAIVPVPLHRWRLLKRRYNQAAELARPIARRWRKPYLADALVRPRPGGQSGKSASGRRREAAGAFVTPPGRRRQLEGRRILLIDDVLTTGATAEACSRALLRAGAKAVDLAVIARVREASGSS